MQDLLQNVIGSGTSCEQIVMIIDNTPCHLNLENVLHEIQEATLLCLAHCLPMLIPVECVWSVIKTQLEQKEANQLSELLAGDPQNILSKSEWKLRFVEKLIDESVIVITSSMCLNFVNHMQSLYGRASR